MRIGQGYIALQNDQGPRSTSARPCFPPPLNYQRALLRPPPLNIFPAKSWPECTVTLMISTIRTTIQYQIQPSSTNTATILQPFCAVSQSQKAFMSRDNQEAAKVARAVSMSSLVQSSIARFPGPPSWVSPSIIVPPGGPPEGLA